jgi:HK97 family phage major capsid protein
MPSIETQVQEKIDQLGTAFDQFKKANDERLKQIESKGSVDPTLEQKLNKANEDVGKLDAELKELKTALNRRPTGGEQEEKDAGRFAQYKATTPFLFREEKFSREADQEYKAAMNSYMRRGREEKALSSGSDPSGGYLVRPEVGEMIQTKLFETSPFRQYFGSIQISSDAFEAPTDGDEIEAKWAGETDARNETGTFGIGMLSIPTHELTASPKATQKLLDDAGYDVESMLGAKAVDKFARTEANVFANGNGVKKPRGFLTFAAGTGAGQIEQIKSGHASQLTADGIIDLVGALKSGYRKGSVFFATRLSISAARKLKGNDNNYLWQPGLQADKPSTLLGSPIEEAADMQEIAAGSLPIAYGNFKVGYLIVDRIGVRILRDPYTKKPFVVFDFTKRVGGDVVVHEAIKLLKVGT